MIYKEFERIQSKVKEFKYSSMEYSDFEDISNYEVILENNNIILIHGHNVEAEIDEYHWATNNVESLIYNLKDKKEFLITFIPHEWLSLLEVEGYVVRNAWKDYFKENLDDINILDCFEMLTLDKCSEASEITKMCKNQSRGFTGQSAKWIEDWISNEENKNSAVLMEKNNKDEIIGIICIATYSHESEKGPILWIREVAVNPKYQNRGIGRKLIMKALSYGKKFNATRSFLTADECNDSGIHLYTSIGFKAGEDDSQIDMIKKC